MTFFRFPVEVVSDEDAWLARVPELETIGAATWGRTCEEALRHMQEVMEMIVEEFLEPGKGIPQAEIQPDKQTVTVKVAEPSSS